MIKTQPGEEGVLDPAVEEWLKDNPQLDWPDGFPPEILEAARTFQSFPSTRQIEWVEDSVVGGVPVRIYRDDDSSGGLIVYFHGGAFMVGGINVMDGVAREIAFATRATVVSVGYRLAPEYPYPAGLEDCVFVTQSALSNPEIYGATAGPVVVAGESAGGNLASAVSLVLRDRGSEELEGQVLIYPCTDSADASYPSRVQFGSSKWTWEAYGGGRDLSKDPYAVPMCAASLQNLPPALVLLAGCDALRDEGRAYARRLSEHGVEVEEFCFADQPHGFINYQLPAAVEAYDRIGIWIRRHLLNPSS